MVMTGGSCCLPATFCNKASMAGCSLGIFLDPSLRVSLSVATKLDFVCESRASQHWQPVDSNTNHRLSIKLNIKCLIRC